MSTTFSPPTGTQENITGLPGAMTDQYWIRRLRKLVSGTHLVPIAGSTGTAAQFVSLHAPFGLETVYWAAVMEGQPPMVPDPSLIGDSNHTFLWGEQCADAPMLLPSGVGHTWLIAGIYYYGFILPVQLNADFPTAVPPFDPTPLVQSTYPAARFNTGILSGGQATLTVNQFLQNVRGAGG